MKKQIFTGIIILAVLLVALLTRLGAVVVPLKDFDSDEAVVGLMARDILAGESWPIFYAGQSYLGALEPWSVAASFSLFGESALSLRLVPLLYSLTFLVAAYFLLRRFFGRSATGLILLWTALGTPILKLWTVKARGGFAEVLLIGTLFLLLFERCWRLNDPGTARLIALAFVAGFGLFVNPLIGTIMAVPLALLVARVFDECRPLLAAEDWSINDLILFRPLRKGARAMFSALSGVGILALALAISLILLGEETLESGTGMNLPEGTQVALYAALYFALLYVAELAILARARPGGLRGLLQKLWKGSAGLRMLLAIAAGHFVLSIAASSAAAQIGGGGHSQPFRLAPLVTWPERLLFLFGQVVPTAFWPLAGWVGPLLAAMCVWLVVRLWQQRRELGLAHDGAPGPIPPLTMFGGTTLATLFLVVTSTYAKDATAARYLLPLLLCLPATLYLLLNPGLTGRWAATEPARATGRSQPGGRQNLRYVLLASITIGLAAGSMWGQASLLAPRSSGSPYPGLVDDLESRGMERIIADYWTAYPLAFLAAGKLEVAPAYGADRFPAVSSRVRSEGPDAYVFEEGRSPLEEFRASFRAGEVREDVLRPAAGGPRYHLFTFER
jgi:hypothetical protein